MSSPNKTRVQVATDEQFTDIIVDEVGDYKTTLALASAELPVGSNLYIRGMHGHPDTGDSPWSTVHQFKVMTPYANELFYTAGDYTFTVPTGVYEVCIAMTPGADYSSAGELLKAYTGKTVACVAGNNSVPVGISSITLSGKGAAGTSTYQWNYNRNYCSHAPYNGLVTNYPTTLPYAYPASITANRNNPPISGLSNVFNFLSVTSDTLTYRHIANFYDTNGKIIGTLYYYLEYKKATVSTTTGDSTTAVVNDTTYTFPGGVGGAATITEHVVEINPAIGATIAATIASGGTLSYSYSAYAINALSSLLGSNFTLSPVAADIGTYVGGIAAWRNTIPVTPGDTIPVHVSTGGAVNIIWGTGRSFPNSEV